MASDLLRKETRLKNLNSISKNAAEIKGRIFQINTMEGIMQSESYYIDIKRDQADNLKTPCYILDIDRFEENLANIKNSFEQYWNQRLILGFSFKTNHMKELIQCAKKNGMYAETVSDDEYNLALELGYSPEKIIYNGPQKSEKQLIEALKNGSIVNLDNLDEILAVEGIDVYFIGPGDLSTSLGMNTTDPEFLAIIEKTIKKIVAAGRNAGYYVGNAAAAKQAMDWGAKYLVTAITPYMAAGAKKFLLDVRTGKDNEVAVKDAY